MEHDMDDRSLNRREFLRKAAITGAVAWAMPVIQTVAAGPAAAATPLCCHSPNDPGTEGCEQGCEGCMEACQASDTGSGCKQGGTCQTNCTSLCPIGTACRQCTDSRACDPDCWVNCTFTTTNTGCGTA